jgi:chitodextrinase
MPGVVVGAWVRARALDWPRGSRPVAVAAALAVVASLVAAIPAGAQESPTLSIDRVLPDKAASTGMEVQILGSGFESGVTEVRFGDRAKPGDQVSIPCGPTSPNCIVWSDSDIIVLAPPHAASDDVPITVVSATEEVTKSKKTIQTADGPKEVPLFSYTPTSGIWTACPPEVALVPAPRCPGALNAARYGHTATVLEGPGCHPSCGKVLVVGGFRENPDRTSDVRVHEFALASTEVYDPRTGVWTSCSAPDQTPSCPGPLTEARGRHAATLLSGPRCEVPAPPSWCGKVLVVGGNGGFFKANFGWHYDTDHRDSSELYDPATGSWSSCSSAGETPTPSCPGRLALARSILSVTQLSGSECRTASVPDHCGNIVAAGGFYRNEAQGNVLPEGADLQDSTREVELYDPDSGTWRTTTPLVFDRYDHTATLLTAPRCGGGSPPDWCGKVLVVGGDTNRGFTPRCSNCPMDQVELYDPEKETWTTCANNKAGTSACPASTNVARWLHFAVLLRDGGVLVAGQNNGDRSGELYNPDTGVWRTTNNNLGKQRTSGVAGLLLPNGSVLAAGGDSSFLESATEIYDGNKWSFGPSMRDVHHGAEILLLSDGRALVVGGRTRGFDRSAGSLEERDGESAVTELFTPAPSLVKLVPPTGAAVGGEQIKIVGTGFTSTDSVRFGDQEAAFTVDPTGTEITATVPEATTLRTVDVAVTNPGGSDALKNAFTYTGPPGSVGELTAPTIEGKKVVLGFAAAGGVANTSPPATKYLLRMSKTGPISDDQSFAAATPLTCQGNVVCPYNPAAVGDPLDFTVTGLQPETGYHFAVRAQGDDGLLGPISSLSVTTAAVLPAKVTGIKAKPLSDTKVRIEFPAVGSNGSDGPVAGAYVVRQSQSPINNDASFDAATALCSDGVCDSDDGFSPTSIGDPLVLEITDLSPETTYFYAIKARDAAGNLGPISDPVEVKTLALEGQVNDLVAQATSATEIKLTFSAPEVGGKAASEYVIKRSKTPITDAVFGAATSVCDGGTCKLSPANPGDKLTVSAKGLDPDTEYFFALKVAKGGGQLGPMSNVAQAETLVAGAIGAVEDLSARVLSSDAVELTFSAVGSDGKPATRYVVKRSATPIVDGAAFDAATSVCAGDCVFTVNSIGEKLVLPVADLDPDTTYFFGLKAKVADRTGPLSNIVEAKTLAPGEIGAVTDLAAEPLSKTEIRLKFTAVGEDAAPVTDYVVKQSSSEIDGPGFDSATSLCGGVCKFTVQQPGDRVTLRVTDLKPDATYHYALKPKGPSGKLGTMSNPAQATTLAADAGPIAGSVSFPAGYSLVGVPGGTQLTADAPLYSWFNKGSGGRYEVVAADAPLASGRGYWAFFSAAREAAISRGKATARFALGAYRASMVGNPSGERRARVTGHDFAAKWDPSANGGAGGYRISRYRQPQRIDVGEAIWVFSYRKTKVKISTK